MKILHLIDSGGLYGAEVMLVSLAVEQQKQGLVVVIGSIGTPGLKEKPLEQEARLRSVPVQRFDMKPGLNAFGALRLLKYAWSNDFDLIHSHGYKTNILLGFIPKFLRRLPLVSTLHGWTHTKGWNKMRINECLDALALKYVDKIVLVNRGMLERKDVQKLPMDKIQIINNGIETLETTPGPDAASSDGTLELQINSFCESGTVLLSIGRLSTEKGYQFLIEAVATLRNEYHKNIKLMLIGDGYLRDELQRQVASLDMNDSFLITGYLDNARRYLDRADIYVNSSLTEGLPITLLEAMAGGIPIIASAVGGIPHVVTDQQDCLLVPEQDPQSMAQAVLDIMNNPDRAQKRARAAQQKVRQNFGVTEMTVNYQTVYDSII